MHYEQRKEPFGFQTQVSTSNFGVLGQCGWEGLRRSKHEDRHHGSSLQCVLFTTATSVCISTHFKGDWDHKIFSTSEFASISKKVKMRILKFFLPPPKCTDLFILSTAWYGAPTVLGVWDMHAPNTEGAGTLWDRLKSAQGSSEHSWFGCHTTMGHLVN